MKQGDFTALAKFYHNRPGYSSTVLSVLKSYTQSTASSDFLVADVGAGTGKLTENLLELGLKCVAVEPNEEMRRAGVDYLQRFKMYIQEGSAEKTGLKDRSVHWVTMGSSFHWAKPEVALPEFHRILKPGGFFTAIWNPRDLERSEFHQGIEKKVQEIVPGLKRVSSGGERYTKGIESVLASTGHFGDVVFVEALHDIPMPKERFLGAWRSVNDIQAQAGPERFQQILSMIESECAGMDTVMVPYKTRAWTARSV